MPATTMSRISIHRSMHSNPTTKSLDHPLHPSYRPKLLQRTCPRHSLAQRARTANPIVAFKEDEHGGQHGPSPSSSSSTFIWTKHWYPLAPLSYLDTSKPSSHIVLGRKLAVWRDVKKKQWHAFEDRCPHRLAPLSEGRIDKTTNTLHCSYHGWSFGVDGSLVDIPQADSQQQLEAVQQSRKACVALLYPVTERSGLLWVWMEPGTDALLESNFHQPALPPELVNKKGLLLGDWYMRELPISYELLMENLLDPSHINFAHHGVIGNRDKGRPIKLVPQGELTAEEGFILKTIGNEVGRNGIPSMSYFLPPSLARLSIPVNKENTVSLVFYAVPAAPGSSRIIAGYSTDFQLPALLQPFLSAQALAPILHAFQWAGDLANHQVLDGDTLILRYQEETLRERGGDWKQEYFLPAQADKGVVMFRQWVDQLAGGGPDYGWNTNSNSSNNLVSSRRLSRREILDRYQQHTAICPYCSKAYSRVKTVRKLAQGATAGGFAAAFLAAVLQAAGPVRPLARSGLPLLMLPLAFGIGLSTQALEKLEEQFVYKDYTHGDR